MNDDFGTLQERRLDAYRIVALYARAYMQAVDAQDPTWEHVYHEDLNTALLRARTIENQIHQEAAA